jgi:uncharacterized protein YdeI (YjbR/CyaY-like superfamily)
LTAPDDTVHPLTREAWRAWLERHHRRGTGVWLVFFRKATGQPRVEYEEAVEEALCFGWIDSKPGKLDEDRSMLWFAPRKPGSGWARPNKRRVERLVLEGRMSAFALERIEAAKRDGSWNRLYAVEDLVVPDDLVAALAWHPRAAEHFEAFPRSVKRGILEWIVNAKRPETRAKRIAETARMAAANERANQWKP